MQIKCFRVPMGIMLDTPTGNFKNLMADTVSKLEDSMAHFMPEITSNIVGSPCCILLVFILDWRMGLAALITIPLGLFGIHWNDERLCEQKYYFMKIAKRDEQYAG